MIRFLKLALAFAIFSVSHAAYASSDSSCYPEWKIKQSDMNGCSSTALLSPGNDTRVNMLMLLNDRYGATGAINMISYNSEDRRGDAEPFDYPIFASALGPVATKPEDDVNADNAGMGSRCVSNDAGTIAFNAALDAASGITADERAILSTVRLALKPQCTDGEGASAIVQSGVASVKSAQGQIFARYLIAAASFYEGDFASARNNFALGAKSGLPWIAQASAYMLGRVELNTALDGAFDEWGSFNDKVDNKSALTAAENAFNAYLKSYPTGSYAPSARGLLRKVYWMSKQNDKLLAEYIWQFKQTAAARGGVSLADLVQEMDIKMASDIDSAKVSDPLVLAMLDLKSMRHSDDRAATDDPKPITRAAIEAQHSRFAGNEALYAYLLAAQAYYVGNDADAVLQLIPAATENSSYLGYSRQLLRALALDAKGDAGARGALIALISAAKHPFQHGAAELALAMHLERAKNLALVFAAGSPIHDPNIREILLRYAAAPSLLRAQAQSTKAPKQERDVALYGLLYKELTRGYYADFVKDVALVPANAKPRAEDDYSTPSYTVVSAFKWAGTKDFPCPSIAAVAQNLVTSPKDQQAQLCVGEFIRLNNLDPDFYGASNAFDANPPKDELGGAASQFPGIAYSRGEVYKAIIADPKATATNKAYALYRAVNCYGPSGNNGCGGTDVPIATRKAWFNRLRSEFGASIWAKKLRYYW